MGLSSYIKQQWSNVKPDKVTKPKVQMSQGARQTILGGQHPNSALYKQQVEMKRTNDAKKLAAAKKKGKQKALDPGQGTGVERNPFNY